MVNDILNKKKLIICYEDRENFKRKFRTKVGEKIAESWSRFLIDNESINNIVKYLKTKINIELIELNNVEKLKEVINNENFSNILIWNISDGVDIYKGSYVPAFAKLFNIKFYGSETYSQYIAQNKFKFLSICQKLNIPIPKTILYSYKMNKFFPSLPNTLFDKNTTLFVKPNSFDNNIGIRCNAKIDLKYLKCNIKEISNTLKSDTLIQEYIDGYDVRVCYIGKSYIEKNKIGCLKVEKYNPYNKELVEYINETEAEDIECIVSKLNNIKLCEKIKKDVLKIVNVLNLKDYFAFDVRIDKNDNYYFLELNTAPFVINKIMETYAKVYYNKDIKEVFFESIINAFE